MGISRFILGNLLISLGVGLVLYSLGVPPLVLVVGGALIGAGMARLVIPEGEGI